MEENPLRESIRKHKEKLALDLEKATLLVPVDEMIIPTALEKSAEDAGLLKKDELHITILGTNRGEEILKIFEGLPEGEKSNLLDRISDLIQETDWSVSPIPEYYEISKEYSSQGELEKRTSYIQMVDMPGAKTFYEAFNALLGTHFAEPFPHITLFTTSTREDKKLRGIGIDSEEDFLQLNPVEINIL
jgi:hypothetical protein